MRLYFIRHGKTAGNREKRYIGKTDEHLCDEGIAELKSNTYPGAKIVISSPLVRCVETAKIIYPNEKAVVCGGLRECDFGEFEGKNYEELSGSEAYQRWIESGGRMAFPGGEDMAGFSARTVCAFEALFPRLIDETAFVVHGGTIMALLERYGEPKKEFYDYYTENGHGMAVDFDFEIMRVRGKL